MSLCSPGTSSVDQASRELRDLLASVSQVVGLKACASTSSLTSFLYTKFSSSIHVRINVRVSFSSENEENSVVHTHPLKTCRLPLYLGYWEQYWATGNSTPVNLGVHVLGFLIPAGS